MAELAFSTFGRRQVMIGAGATMLLTSCAAANSAAGDPVAQTRSGRIRGRIEHGVASFRGVPYGAPTSGANRFAPPRPPVAWQGVRDAGAWGLTAPQRPIARYPVLESWDAGFDAAPKGEDCLVLNVWTPAADAGDRPVMVYFHGGGFTGRSGSRDCFNGAELARRSDVVVVTINHRLNIFGYMYLGHLDPALADSGNAGTLDTIASLQWVRDNIAGFGGDPGNVTIFGQSGGGLKASVLLASPAAQGLYHRAILQSGSYMRGVSTEQAAAATDGFLASIGIGRGDIDRLRTMPWRDLVVATQRAVGSPYSDRHFQPVVDGRTLPDGPWYPSAPALSRSVPLMIGTTRTETTMLLGSNDPGVFAIDDGELRRRLAPWVEGADVGQIVSAYRASRPQATPADLYFAITTAIRFRRPARVQADQRLGQAGAPVYMYEIEWATPADGGKWGSPHSMDHGLVFHNLRGNESMYGDSPDVPALAAQMSPAWGAFARSGDPNHSGLPRWPEYSAGDRATMMFNVRSHVERDPWGPDLAAIESLPVVPRDGDPLTRSLR